MAERAKRSAAAKKAASAKTKSGSGGKRKRAAAGHNSGIIPDEVILRYDGKIDTAEKAYERAKLVANSRKGELAALYRAAKEDGVNIDALKDAREKDASDHNQVAINHNDVGRYLRLKKSPLAVQLNLFGEVDLPPPISAALAGAQAGRNAEPPENNPHTPGTDEFEAWAQAHAGAIEETRDSFSRGARLN